MNDLTAIRKEFLDIYAAVRHLDDDAILHGPTDDSHPHFQRLNALAALEVDDSLARELWQDSALQPVIRHISHLKRMNGLRLEIECAKAIITSNDPWLELERFLYYPNYLELARMEYHGAGLCPGGLVVFLGSGPLPLSLICLCRRYGISGTGIEQVPEYAEISSRLIRSLGLEEHLFIVCGNHYALSATTRFDLIMVGADAMPKDEIFAHLATILPDNARISYRIYEKGLRRLLDTHAAISLPASLVEHTRVRPAPPVNNTAVFVVKKSAG